MGRAEDSSDDDFPLDEDVDLEEASDADMICPQCRRPVVEDAQKCPHCGDWITPIDGSSRRWRRVLLIAAVLIMLGLTLLMAF